MNIHFVGIGGIGVSALAQYYLAKGDKITGSDLSKSDIIDLLKKKGAKIITGKHSAKNLPPRTDLVIYTPAVRPDNPELKNAKKLNIKVKSYPRALGYLTKDFFTIAISGTHGKSTTTSMLALILAQSGLDPTVIVGTKLKEFGESNFRMGKSKYLVIEADEYQASFLNYSPKIIVLTNIEEDHLDYYKDINHILKTFKEYIKKTEVVIANRDDRNIKRIIKSAGKKVRCFGFPKTKGLKLKIPGEHNVYNAMAAMEVARYLGVGDSESIKSLNKYNGSWRRFEMIKAGDNILVSDYGHHPTEIKKTLLAAREKFGKKKIACIFQPHQYERTAFFLDDFAKSLKMSGADKVIILDIYEVSGREGKNIKREVDSRKLVEMIGNDSVIYAKNEKDALKKALEIMGLKDVLIIMGAGDIHNKLYSKALKSLTIRAKGKKMK